MANEANKDEWADFRANVKAEGIPQTEADDWAPFNPARPVMGDVAMAGQQFSAGAAEGSGGLAGGLAGAKAALALPIPNPYLKGAAVIGGGVAGLFGGSSLVNEALDIADVPAPEDLPPDQRPLAYASRSLGGAVPFIAAPYVAAQRGVVLTDSGVGKLANQIIQTAKTQPKVFGAVEGVAAISAATAAGIAEEVAPGETGIRVGAEITAGMLAPGALTVKAYRSTSRVVRNVISKMSESSRETVAGRMLTEMFDKAGEDPTAVVEMLKINGVMDEQGKILDESLNNAQRTGSEALGALQKYLADTNPEFKAALSKQEQESLDAMRGIISLLGKTGDPQALTTAAEMKSQYVRSLLQALVDSKTDEALLQARKISVDSPEARMELSTATRDALMSVVSEVRKTERSLWAQVPDQVSAEISSLQSTFDDLKATMLPELVNQKLPKTVASFLSRKAAEAKGSGYVIFIPDEFRSAQQPFGMPTTATTGELKQLRSELMDMARESTNAGNFSQARIYSDLANAALDDIDKAFAQAGDDAYRDARRFSKEMNDVFTRSFVGRVTGQGKYGDRVAPELTLHKALASGKDAADINFQQLQDATQFLDVRGMGTDVTQESAQVVLDAQERFTRLMFANAVDPVTGLVGEKRLKTLVRENEALLNRFPEVKEQVHKALTSEAERKAMSDWVGGKLKAVERIKAFEQALGKDPITLAQRALASADSEKELRKLVSLTKGGAVAGFDGEQAKQALSASVLAAARRQSTDSDGVLNLERYMTILTKPSGVKGPSPLEVLTSAKVLDADHKKSIDTVLRVMEKIRTSHTPGHAFESGENVSNAALSLIARMAGTSVVGAASKTVTGKGASIQAHAAGANFANIITQKLTTAKVDDLLIQALNDKDFLVKLLQKADTPEAVEIQARQINAWLMQSMVSAATSEDEQ